MNLRRFSFESLHSAGRLPGTERDRYRRVSPLALLVAGPVIGGLYVVFLPFIGIAMLTWIAGGKAAQLVTNAAASSGRVLRPAWRPGGTFLAGAKRSESTRKREDRWQAEIKKQLAEEQDENGGNGEGGHAAS